MALHGDTPNKTKRMTRSFIHSICAVCLYYARISHAFIITAVKHWAAAARARQRRDVACPNIVLINCINNMRPRIERRTLWTAVMRVCCKLYIPTIIIIYAYPYMRYIRRIEPILIEGCPYYRIYSLYSFIEIVCAARVARVCGITDCYQTYFNRCWCAKRTSHCDNICLWDDQ